jgi:glutamyl-tRNA reductase
MLLIDLAVPTNIDETLAKNKNITLCDLDCISQELESNMESRLNAIERVIIIITEELSGYSEWLQQATFRESLVDQKRIIFQKLNIYFKNNSFEYSEDLFKIVTNRILKEIIKLNSPSITSKELDVIISQQLSHLTEVSA